MIYDVGIQALDGGLLRLTYRKQRSGRSAVPNALQTHTPKPITMVSCLDVFLSTKVILKLRPNIHVHYWFRYRKSLVRTLYRTSDFCSILAMAGRVRIDQDDIVTIFHRLFVPLPPCGFSGCELTKFRVKSLTPKGTYRSLLRYRRRSRR